MVANTNGRSLASVECLVRMTVMGPPGWRTIGAALESPYDIPILPLVDAQDLPEWTCAFDKLPDAHIPSETLVNFNVEEAKLVRLIRNPGRLVPESAPMWGATSPDFSIWDQAPLQFGIMATWLNRTIGRLYVERGVRVVPQIRWTGPRDYAYCFAGVQTGSVVYVSTYGCWRQTWEREAFIAGLGPMRECIRPSVVLLHGPRDWRVTRELGSTTQLVPLTSTRVRQRKAQ